jgi:hypothetical protein
MGWILKELIIMIITEQIDERLIKSYSDRGKMIAPTYDRLGKEFNSQALYSEAVDIIVDGLPRFHYIETEIDVEVEKPEEEMEVQE